MIHSKISMKKRNLNAPTTVKDLDDMVAQIGIVIAKTLEDYPNKEYLDKKLSTFATKEDLKGTEKRLEGKIEEVGGDVSDIRRRVIDLETDTITRREFNELKTKLLPV